MNFLFPPGPTQMTELTRVWISTTRSWLPGPGQSGAAAASDLPRLISMSEELFHKDNKN